MPYLHGDRRVVGELPEYRAILDFLAEFGSGVDHYQEILDIKIPPNACRRRGVERRTDMLKGNWVDGFELKVGFSHWGGSGG